MTPSAAGSPTPTPVASAAGSGRPVVVTAPDRFEGRTLRCGVVGVGRMGQHHARVYSNLPNCTLVGVVDANDDRRGAIAGKFETTPMASVDQILAAGVDCVSIAVPTTHHYAAAEPLLKAGVACLIEKPLAGDVETARKLKDLADSTGSVLMVGHIERFNPVMRAMRKATAAGDPIIPRFLEIHRVSPMTFRSVDVGVVMDMMIHDLDVVLMLMDGQEPDEVEASGVAVITEHEDICNARLTWRKARIASGKTVVCNITASRLALKTERIARITGENCYVKIDYGAKSGTLIRRIANELQMREVRDQIRSGADLTHLKWHELVNIEPLTVDDAEPIVAEISAFLDAVRTGSRPPIDAEAGFANVRTAGRIVTAIQESL